MVKTCKICGREFKPANSNQKCCCKDCSRENDRIWSREYSRRNKEKLKRTRMIWYEKNREHVLEYSRSYYREHKEELREYYHERYLENRESILEKRRYNRKVRPLMEACREKHNGCFDCPREDGECLYE